ncbi:MAG: hypothetical protein ACRC2S_23755 [Waterburya sp.]
MNNYIDSQLLELISPEKISLYLKTNGWIKIAEKASLGSIWELEENPEISLLLPLNQKYSDFEKRMFEVILILEKVEKRPRLEIIKGLTRTSDTAIKRNREIIEVKTKSIYKNRYEIKAREVGIFLKAMQDYYDTFGKLAFMNEEIESKDVPARKTQRNSELELSLVDTFYGSFGLVLGLGEKGNTKETEETISAQATEQLIHLIQDTNSKNLDSFKIKISSLNKDIFNEFKKIINYLLKLESNIFFDWGSTARNKGGVAEISHEKLISVKELIAKEEIENPDIIIEKGKFISFGFGKSQKDRKFVFDGYLYKKRYEGIVDLQLANSLVESGKRFESVQGICQIELERTIKINELHQNTKEKYKLISIEKVIT